MRRRETSETLESRTSGAERGLLVLLVAVAAALRFHELGSQLWIDEIAALTHSIQRSTLEILTTWPGPSSHVFYELLAHGGWRVLGESPVVIRLPAVLFGIGGVWAIHRFARSFLAPRYALGAAALLAVSYIHVFQSQNARGYTALIFFFLVASTELVRFHRTRSVSVRGGAVYASAGVLAGYSQLFGVVILPAQLALASGWWALERKRRPGRPAFPLRAFLPWASGGILLTGLLYLPFVESILGFAAERSALPGEGPRLGWGLLREAVGGLTAALGGPVSLALAAAVGAVGAILWWRRSSFAFLVCVSPLLLQLLVFAGLGARVHPRYLALALPTAYMLGAVGLLGALEAVSRHLLPTDRGWTRPATGLLFGLAALLSALPLRGYYRAPKQDFLGAIRYVEAHAEPADRRVGVSIAGRVLAGFYGADFVAVDSLDDLEALESQGGTLWVVTTLEGILGAGDPALIGHLRERYDRVGLLPGTVGDGAMRIYRREIDRGG